MSGPPHLGLFWSDFEEKCIIRFDGKEVHVFVGGEFREKIIYDLERSKKGEYCLSLTQWIVLPGETEPLLHGRGRMPFVWISEDEFQVIHNVSGELTFTRVK